MWKGLLKLLCLLTVAGNVLAYVNSDDSFSHRTQNSKTALLNYHLQRFRSQVYGTTRPKTFANRSYPSSLNYRKYQSNKNVPVTESAQHKLRHTRFPKMDSLLSKISGLESDKGKRIVYQWTTTESPYWKSVRTTTETQDELEDNYEDTEDVDDVKKSDNVSPDWEDDDDETDSDGDYEEGDGADDAEKGWQAEEATEAPERTLTDFKWRHYGTRSRVEESRRNQRIAGNSNEYKDIHSAVQHALLVNREAGCRLPRPRVVSVQSAYPDPAKTYIPRCTLLHQCGDDAGCCKADSMTCAPKHTERVELYFYANTVGRQGNFVEKLLFYNHTECECVDRSSIMSSDHPQTTHLRSGVSFRPAAHETLPAPAAIRRCRCPELYSAQTSQESQCRCDCSDGNRDCIRIKRGKEYFSLKDRLCIQNGQCGYPVCDFGSYIRHSGRCPRKQEKFDAFARMTPK